MINMVNNNVSLLTADRVEVAHAIYGKYTTELHWLTIEKPLLPFTKISQTKIFINIDAEKLAEVLPFIRFAFDMQRCRIKAISSDGGRCPQSKFLCKK